MEGGGWEGKGDWPGFSETVFRLPSYISCMFFLVGLGLLTRSFGGSIAGVVVVWLCVLHPWIIRYGSEGRGYMLSMCAWVWSLFFLKRAWEEKRADRSVNWWMWYGVFSFVVLYAYMGMIYGMFVLHSFLVGMFIWSWVRGRWGKEVLNDNFERKAVVDVSSWRWLSSNLLMSGFLCFLVVVSLPQMAKFIAKERHDFEHGWSHVLDIFSHLEIGTYWQPWMVGLESSFSFIPQLKSSLWLLEGTLILGFVFLFIGVFVMLRSGVLGRIILVGLWSPGLVIVIHGLTAGHRFYPWYAISLLPALLVGVSLGINGAMGLIKEIASQTIKRRTISNEKKWLWWPTWGLISSFMLIIYGIGYVGLTNGMRQNLCQRPLELNRKIAQSMRPSKKHLLERENEGVITYDVMMHSRVYDPQCIKNRRVETLKKAIEMAKKQEDCELYAIVSFPDLLRSFGSELISIIEDEKIFEPPVFYSGLQPFSTRYVYRMKKEKSSQKSK